MPASYPSTVAVFPTHSDNTDTIFAADVNTPNAEIVAVETGLLNGFQHDLVPLADDQKSLGGVSKRWLKGWFQDIDLDGTFTVNGVPFTTFQTPLNTLASGRLTLSPGTPVTTADVTAATTLYWTPYQGKYIALFDGVSIWTTVAFSETSIIVPASSSQMYDVFVFNNAGVATLEVLAWLTDSARATALVLQDGVLVKSGATTRRYIGSFRTTTIAGQTEDSKTNRLVWNYYNRVNRPLLRQESTASWAYGTSTVRQANASTANQVSVVVGVQEVQIDLTIAVHAEANATITAVIGFGEGTMTTPVTNALLATAIAGTLSADASGVVNGGQALARLLKLAPLGATTYTWEEWASGSGFTFYGTPATPSGPSGSANGISGSIEG